MEQVFRSTEGEIFPYIRVTSYMWVLHLYMYYNRGTEYLPFTSRPHIRSIVHFVINVNLMS